MGGKVVGAVVGSVVAEGSVVEEGAVLGVVDGVVEVLAKPEPKVLSLPTPKIRERPGILPPTRRWAAVAAMLVLFLLLPTIRAAMLGWQRNADEFYAGYSYSGQTEVQRQDYTFGWLPEGLTEYAPPQHTQADIHEQDTAYLAACREVGRAAADFYGWKTVQCVRDGAMRSIADIHQEIYRCVSACLEG